MFGYKNLFFITIAFAFHSVNAIGAEPPKSYRVTGSSCRVMQGDGKSWKPSQALSLKPGNTLMASPYGGKTEWLILKSNNQWFLVEKGCLKAEASQNESVATPSPATEAASSETLADVGHAPIEKRNSFFGEISFVSWQDTLTLTATDGHTSTVLGHIFTICPGIGKIFALGNYFSGGFSACGLVGTALLASRSDIPEADQLYSSEGIGVFGLNSGVSILARPAGGSFAIGLTVPVVLRFATWPGSSGGYTLTPGSTFMSGALLDSRLERGSFFLSPKIGYMTGTAGYVWELQSGLYF